MSLLREADRRTAANQGCNTRARLHWNKPSQRSHGLVQYRRNSRGFLFTAGKVYDLIKSNQAVFPSFQFNSSLFSKLLDRIISVARSGVYRPNRPTDPACDLIKLHSPVHCRLSFTRIVVDHECSSVGVRSELRWILGGGLVREKDEYNRLI